MQALQSALAALVPPQREAKPAGKPGHSKREDLVTEGEAASGRRDTSRHFEARRGGKKQLRPERRRVAGHWL